MDVGEDETPYTAREKEAEGTINACAAVGEEELDEEVAGNPSKRRSPPISSERVTKLSLTNLWIFRQLPRHSFSNMDRRMMIKSIGQFCQILSKSLSVRWKQGKRWDHDETTHQHAILS